MSLQPKRALDVWQKEEMGALYLHLHNGNGDKDFVMGFREETGARKYVRSKNVPVGEIIVRSIKTVEGEGNPKWRVAFTPYARNSRNLSRWGGLDFDAHDESPESLARARRWAFAAWRLLLNCGHAVILESSGSGGWHVWAISQHFIPTSAWTKMLSKVAKQIGVSPEQPEKGIWEMFPQDRITSSLGSPMRAPGSWNPSTGRCSEIFAETVSLELLDTLERLPPQSKKHSPVSLIKERNSFDETHKPSSQGVAEYLELIADKYLPDYTISRARTRHGKLEKLVGYVFRQVGRLTAEHLARVQFKRKEVETTATIEEHMAEFNGLWRGLERKFVESLSRDERLKFDRLVSNQPHAFKIIRGYATKARDERNREFAISKANLAERLGITSQGAGKLVGDLQNAGIIEQTQRYKPKISAAKYRWLLDLPNRETEEPF